MPFHDLEALIRGSVVMVPPEPVPIRGPSRAGAACARPGAGSRPGTAREGRRHPAGLPAILRF
jgi:hypothetical protein